MQKTIISIICFLFYFSIHTERKVYNVSEFGANGKDKLDDTDAIQKAIDYTSKKKVTLYVPEGIYYITAHVGHTSSTNYLRDEGGLSIKSNSHIKLHEKAIIRAVSNHKDQYNIVRLYEVENIVLEGGVIEGDRHTSTNTSGQWGYGLAVLGSRNIEIKNLTIKNCRGDGINFQISEPRLIAPKNVSLTNVILDNNKRQGISIEAGSQLYFRNCVFSNTHGLAPQSGVDMEPWSPSVILEDINFEKCVFKDNKSNNLLLNHDKIRNLTVQNCIFLASNSEAVSQHLYTIYDGIEAKFINNNFDKNAANILIRGSKKLTFDKNKFQNNIVVNYTQDSEAHRTENITFINNDFSNLSLVANHRNNLIFIQHNIFKNSTIYLNNSNALVEKNTFLNNEKSKFLAASNNTKLRLYENTFKNGVMHAIEVFSNANISNNFFEKVDNGILIHPNSRDIIIHQNNFSKIKHSGIYFLDATIGKNTYLSIKDNVLNNSKLFDNSLYPNLLQSKGNQIKK